MVLVTGDTAVAAEARALLPRVRTAAVKEDLNTHAATHLHPQRARDLIRAEAEKAVNLLLDDIVAALKQGERVNISGFGTFNVRKKMARRGRNPKTGEDLEITPRRVITFRVSNQLKEEVEKLNA